MGSVISVPMTAAATVVGALVFVNEVGSRAFDDERPRDRRRGRPPGGAGDRERADRRRAGAGRRRAPARAAAAKPPAACPAGRSRRCTSRPARSTRSAVTSTRSSRSAGGWAVVLGDVSGKGAAAAAVTAEARYTIRTAGTLAADPVAGLHLLDEALRGRDDVALCSVAMVVLPDEPAAATEVFVYLAGHPHPILLHEGRAEPVGEPGPLLGVVENPTWVPTPVTIGPGDQLVLYTDGVIEARGNGRRALRQPALARPARGCHRARARGGAGPWRADGVRRPSSRGRRRAGRDPPRRLGRATSACGSSVASSRPPRFPDGGRVGPRRPPPDRVPGGRRRDRRRLGGPRGRRGRPVPGAGRAEPVARHLRGRALLRPVRDPVRDPSTAGRRARGRRALGARGALVGGGHPRVCSRWPC